MRHTADKPQLGMTANKILIEALEEHITYSLTRQSLTLYVSVIARAWVTQMDGPALMTDKRIYPLVEGTGTDGQPDLDWWTIRITAVCAIALTEKIVTPQDGLKKK